MHALPDSRARKCLDFGGTLQKPDIAPAPDQELDPKQNPKDTQKDKENQKPKPGRIYVTYQKYNNKTHLYYSGRTSMVIDLNKPLRPQAIAAVQARDANHHIDENQEPQDAGFERAYLDKFDAGTAVNYANPETSPHMRPNTARKISCCRTASSNAFISGARRSSPMFGIAA